VLHEHGHAVVVFDKGREPGGRLATRRAGALRFDHGAQYLTARDDGFRRQVRSWVETGVLTEWTGRIVSLSGGQIEPGSGTTTRYVGTPGMSAVARDLARGLDIRSGVRVTALAYAGGAWRLTAEDGSDLGAFHTALVTVPAPQATPLLAGCPELAHASAGARLRPCWAVLAAFDRPLDVPLDGAFVEHPALGWMARNSSKPGRPAGETWVLHAGPQWSEAHLEQEPREVTPLLLKALAESLDRDLPAPAFADAHRWRYALPDPPLDAPCLFDSAARLGAGGDWCGGPKIEGAFLSGGALAGRVLQSAGGAV
jgi:predicted NAD/FAD-dependent oxidoreductase